jgi:hypothetical protein
MDMTEDIPPAHASGSTVSRNEPSLWDSSWGRPPESVNLLYRRGPTAVYRVRGRFQTFERYIL